MGITSSGPWCDVCGNCIMPFGDERVNMFHVEGIEKKLICDNACMKAILKAGKDWTKLPEGPLRDEFKRVASELSRG